MMAGDLETPVGVPAAASPSADSGLNEATSPAASDAPAAASQPAADGSWAEVLERLGRLEESLQKLQALMEERLRYDEAKETAFNRLYAELDGQRKQLAGEPLRPLLRDLAALYDHVVDAARHPTADALDLLRAGLLEVLYRADVEPLPCPEVRYDRSLQRVKRVERTSDPDADWTVAEVLREGFRFRESVLRPQDVVVRRYSAASSDQEPAKS